MIALIAACAKNQVIGNKGCIPWKIKGEQKRFRELTTGNVVIMGMRRDSVRKKSAEADPNPAPRPASGS